MRNVSLMQFLSNNLVKQYSKLLNRFKEIKNDKINNR